MLKSKKINCKICGKVCFSGKRGLCRKHFNEAQKQKQKLLRKKEKAREKRESQVSEKTLDILYSRLVRTIYPRFCHGTCSLEHTKPLPFEGLQNCHCIPRSRSTYLKFNLCNTLPGCPGCNKFSDEHIIYLYKFLCEYWGKEKIDNYHTTYKQKILRLNGVSRKTLYYIFKESLQLAEEKLANKEPLDDLRKSILEKYEIFISSIM